MTFPKHCCLCGGPLADPKASWQGGNNARPLAAGRCCNDCDKRLVIPARIAFELLSKKRPQ